MKSKYFFLLQTIVFAAFLTGAAGVEKAEALTDEAANLFEQSRKSVFQVRVIDLATDEKTSAGSGFYISGEGHLVTNYHVIAEYALEPGRYRIQYIREDGSSGDLKLLDIDVVHDLAVLLNEQKADSYLRLGDSQMSKGERIFSMGNPHDLGMSIIEGTFNGVMEKALYRKILFSASLNPGVSGGPALNHDGEVIGINVSTMGNDVSFLVPVEFLKTLDEKVRAQNTPPVSDWKKTIEDQLLANQDQFISELVGSPWEHLSIGNMRVPGEISPSIKCWGRSADKEKELMTHVKTSCSSEDSIFLSDEADTAHYSYWFLEHTTKEMNAFRFYNHLQEDFENSFSYRNEDNEFFTKFQCQNDFVGIAGQTWKAALCVRQYKKFPRLFDFDLIVSTIGGFDRGLMGELTATGVSAAGGRNLVRKFLEEIQWQK